MLWKENRSEFCQVVEIAKATPFLFGHHPDVSPLPLVKLHIQKGFYVHYFTFEQLR